jgi:predicted transcriptional regulator
MTRRPLTDLRDEMRAVTRGERTAPGHLRQAEASSPPTDLVSALTPANRRLLELIATHQPPTVSALATLAERSQANVSRSLQDLARVGAVSLVREGTAVRPELRIWEVSVNLARNTYQTVPSTMAAG